MIKLVRGEAALRFNEYLVIADTHIGLERDYYFKGYSIPSQTKSMINRLRRIKGRSTKLIILGDLKHNILSATNNELINLKKFINELRNIFEEVIIIKGNHDGNIEKAINGVVKEYFIDNTAFIHGHTVSDKALKADRIIAGHMHPVFIYRNHLGVNQRHKCFIISDKVIVMPAFTDLSAGSNELIKPLKKLIKNEEVLLLDHTKVK